MYLVKQNFPYINPCRLHISIPLFVLLVFGNGFQEDFFFDIARDWSLLTCSSLHLPLWRQKWYLLFSSLQEPLPVTMIIQYNWERIVFCEALWTDSWVLHLGTEVWQQTAVTAPSIVLGSCALWPPSLRMCMLDREGLLASLCPPAWTAEPPAASPGCLCHGCTTAPTESSSWRRQQGPDVPAAALLLKDRVRQKLPEPPLPQPHLEAAGILSALRGFPKVPKSQEKYLGAYSKAGQPQHLGEKWCVWLHGYRKVN